CRKFVVSPGLVELGLIEAKKNEELGALFTGLDGVILVGETRVLPLRSGYLSAGGEEDKVTMVPSLHKAQQYLATVLSAGDTVLFLNDLPDKY
ncbi:MAG: UDP-N-acetylmuramoyl-tripeptide--D-alanyl-D-alanine ligase, partial [Clostridia bacterium]|nr:UDP-N-acetylmuramoyl-tripeptide--D-alanyl-D-alanine ligase [Clostridia bacterium]